LPPSAQAQGGDPAAGARLGDALFRLLHTAIADPGAAAAGCAPGSQAPLISRHTKKAFREALCRTVQDARGIIRLC